MRLKLTWTHNGFDEQVDFFRRRLYVARTLIPQGYEPFFRERARYENAHSSTRIEGNTLPEQQAMLVLVEGSDASKPNEVEKTNLDEAYELIAQLSDDKSTRIDAGLIRTMNSIILKNLRGDASRLRGQWRVGPVLVVDGNTKATRYRPPAPALVGELMDEFAADLQKWTTDGVDMAVVSALAHFGLISIHPFTDGNGRTARLIADMVLHLGGLSADGMIASSPVFLDQRRDYYDILRDVQTEDFMETVDVTRFVHFHVAALQQAAVTLEESAIGLRRRIDQLNTMTNGFLNKRQSLGLQFLFDLTQLSTSTYARLVGTSRATASADLADLTEKQLLVRVGKGRNTRHQLAPHTLGIVTDTSEGSTSESTTPQPAQAGAV